MKMKAPPPLISWVLVSIALILSGNASFADPSATPLPTGKIDPIEANDPEYSGNFDALYQKTWGGGAIPEKYKQLAGISISIVERCETCLRWHMKQAVRLGGQKSGTNRSDPARASHRRLDHDSDRAQGLRTFRRSQSEMISRGE